MTGEKSRVRSSIDQLNFGPGKAQLENTEVDVQGAVCARRCDQYLALRWKGPERKNREGIEQGERRLRSMDRGLTSSRE
jgi:hypothetical protein